MLYGVSAMGRQLSSYTYNRVSKAIEPVALADSASIIIDTAPIERWDTNITQEEGCTIFVAIVEEIKQMVFDLWCVLIYSSIQPFSQTLPEML